jgi:hypothetical protein
MPKVSGLLLFPKCITQAMMRTIGDNFLATSLTALITPGQEALPSGLNSANIQPFKGYLQTKIDG